MILTETMRTMVDSELETFIHTLTDELVAIDKYATLPIIVIHILVSKATFMPYPVLVAYDDKAIMDSLSSLDSYLESMMLDKTPTSVYPTVIIVPPEISLDEVIYNFSDRFYYSNRYIAYGKDLKSMIKNESFIKKIIIKSNKNRNKISLFGLANTESFNNNFILEIDQLVLPELKLPFCSYSRKKESYVSIINKIIVGDKKIFIDGKDIDMKEFFEKVKDKQMVSLNISDTDKVLFFKDFIKTKPQSIEIYHTDDKIDETVDITTVAILLNFKTSKYTHIIFYKYLTNILESVKGEYF